jgi:hypothetical protein
MKLRPYKVTFESAHHTLDWHMIEAEDYQHAMKIALALCPDDDTKVYVTERPKLSSLLGPWRISNIERIQGQYE